MTTSENEKKSRPSKNLSETIGEITRIFIGGGKTCLVDTDNWKLLQNYKWRAVKASRLYYAKTTVGQEPCRVDLSMHRMVARTGPNQVCHHKNRDSLDNRRSNLENMDPLEHGAYHTMNNLIVKFE